MKQEFENLLRLIRGDEAQFELGMQLATNYQVEFEQYYHNNQLISLPVEIGQLQNLTFLDCQNNLLNDAEKDKIRKLLPHCECIF